ncbi:MAG: METTL5 family protein [Candidatus Aenigmarchaeota archaeon]|nr:METTL5 family protein [Candidatus Aenigmarchaeota archaeon]MDW8149332.1 METTL5 family protein [Candidatus Aenigmarchaeota archaeon]
MDKKKLSMFLSRLKKIEDPKYWLEQYSLTPEVAAEILLIAFLNNDIKNKIIIDLGCGNGILTIGAKKLGAKFCIGIDIDKECIRTALENSKKFKKIFYVVGDIKNLFLKKRVDAVLQNPPFGLKSKRHEDINFLKIAFNLSDKVYSLHRNGYRKTFEFIKNFAEKNGFFVLTSLKMKLELFKTFSFHKSHKKVIDVRLYIFKKA